MAINCNGKHNQKGKCGGNNRNGHKVRILCLKYHIIFHITNNFMREKNLSPIIRCQIQKVNLLKVIKPIILDV